MSDKPESIEAAWEAYLEIFDKAKKEREAEGHATPSLFYLEDGERFPDLRRPGHADTER